MWSFGDLSAFPTDVSITKNWTFYLWRSEGMGALSFQPFNYYSTIILFSSIFGSLIAQKMLFLSTLFISFFTFYFFLRQYNVSSISSLLGALFYSFNPVTISEFIGGSMTLVVYAFFPIILFYILKVIQNQNFSLKDAVILGGLGFFIFNLHAAFWYIVIVLPLLYFSKYFLDINLKRYLRLIIPLILIVFILLPNALGYTGLYGATESEKVTFESTADYCYTDATVLNIVRLAGNTGSAQAEEFLNYNTLNGYTILGYILVLVAFLPFVTIDEKNNKQKRMLTTIAVCGFLLLSGLILVIATFPSIVDINPVLSSLRNPVKLFYPLSFALCSLFAIGTERLFNIFIRKRKRHFTTLLSITLVTLILFYNFPALDGTLGLATVRGENYIVEDKYFALPELMAGLDENYIDHLILFLPWDYSQLLKIRSELPNYFGMSVGTGMTQDIDWLKNAFEIALAKNSRDRSHLLGLFGVKYVILVNNYGSYYEGQTWYENLKKDSSYSIYNSNDAYWAIGEINYFNQIFESDPNFEMVHTDYDFTIFRNNYATRKLYAVSDFSNIILNSLPLSENLIQNPSFENNTQNWIIDPENLATISYSDQEKLALTLFGQDNLFTICYQELPVMPNSLYNLTFYVKGFNITDMHAKVLWYNVTDNLTETNSLSVDYLRLSQMNLTEGEWFTSEKILNTPKQAKMVRIYFLANRHMSFSNTSMSIKDVHFNEIELVIKNKNEIFSSISQVNYAKINPTSYEAKINVSSPTFIALSETFNPDWVCYLADEKISSIPIYGIINGFYVNQTGLLELTIEYEPQKLFNYGLTISLLTLTTCAAYLTITYAKNNQLLQRIKNLFIKKTSK